VFFLKTVSTTKNKEEGTRLKFGNIEKEYTHKPGFRAVRS